MNPEKGMSKNRLESLIDGVFAIAMTILVLNLKVPDTFLSASGLIETLSRRSLSFFDYFLSFLLLAIFWTANNRAFHYVRLVDTRLLWLNLISLMFVVLIPYTTTLNSEYRDLWPAIALFDLNIMIVGLSKYFQWQYVTSQNHLIDPRLTAQEIRVGKRINLVVPAVSVVALIIIPIAPGWSTTTFAVIPFIIARFRRGQDRD